MSTAQNTRLGMACAVAAQLCWGCFPIYVYALRSVNSTALVAHRVVWSFALLVAILLLAKLKQHPALPRFEEVACTLRDRGSLKLLALAALLIAFNWLGFIWAVTHDRALDASLGYYICPQVVVLLGVVFQKERLKPLQWIAMALAAVGVAYLSQSTTGVPWLALVVAFSFGFYALVKKRISQTVLVGLTFETGFLFLPAMLFFAYGAATPNTIIVTNQWWSNALLVGTGLATITPLALYTTAIKHIPLSTVGLLQFLGPTLQFLVGVFVLGEPFDHSRLVGFLLVWIGVVIYLAALRRKQIPNSVNM